MENFEALEKKVDRILFYLESDASTHQQGLVEKVSIIEKQVNDILTREKIYLAKATAFGAFGAVIFTIIWNILQIFFTKKL